ncbi:Mur ligase family protein [Nitratiruptor sp. SB155-2]|uniref:Mur ligase family protein n=1 Tax=Nitratiruptor sp. (strain SB155-2) TaxID=387092 RepID=UPI0001587426|nr:UDP-N-acetylmuramoyl-tripeptide--D-alanyl-D-alanine ligase [Nitratiruptor sp. SB155-2]BAF70202.1 UDP-N-acetylmuramoylalanyl-D-glutamyl-2,6-diaminopimelate--D-alanyl-D-alanine ligase [Nitratiruptor sp. SB155-2]
MIWLHFIGHILFVLMLGFYLIQNLQWYNYRFGRVVLHHHAPWQHILFFLAPLFVYIAIREYVLVLDVFYGAILYVWQRKIDKKLVFTARVKRFFLLLFVITLLLDLLCIAKLHCPLFSTIAPLLVALLLSNLIESYLMAIYKKEARKKLETIDPTIIAVTASYGKTSIKNFIYQLLKDSYHVYKTPRSVNTLAGIIKDINTALPQVCEVYVVEAGARERGDILEITKFLNHHYAVVGKVGPQHIEYFKTLENIIATKLEILHSKRLKKAFLWDGLPVKDDPKFVKFGSNIKNVKADLDGVSWDLELQGEIFHFQAPILGGFNAFNITAAILVAKELGIDMATLQKRVSQLKGVEHRLQRIEAGGKVIIDDSFNGNLEGMIASYELVKNYPGRKVVVTPGIVESDEKSNIELAKKINEVFDLAIITGKINKEVLQKNITIEKIMVEDKKQLQNLLAKHTKSGDLILFSNDTPSFM